MNTAAASLPPCTRLAAAWTKDPLDIEDWIRSARRVWRWLKHPRRQKRAEHTARDRDIGREIPDRHGRPASRRTVQRGLAYLDIVLDAIRRDWSGGHGRVIRMALPLAGDGQGEETKAKRKPPPPGAPKPPPAPIPAPPAPSPPAVDEPAAPGDIRREWERIKAETRAEAAAAGAGEAPARPREPVGVDGVERAARALSAAEIAVYEAREARGELTSSERKVLEAARRIHAP